MNIQNNNNREIESYTFKVNSDKFENVLEVYTQGKKAFCFYGDFYGLNFKDIPAGEVADVLKSILDKYHHHDININDINIGEPFIGVYNKEGGELQMIQGDVLDIKKETILIRNLQDVVTEFKKKKLYTQKQGEVLNEVIKAHAPIGCLHALSDNGLPADTMALYWYGLKSGISKNCLKDIIDTEFYVEEKIEKITCLIKASRSIISKEIKQEGYFATDQLIKLIEKLNLQTGKKNTLDDIAKAFKDKDYKKSNSNTQELIDKLAKEFVRQDKLKKIPFGS